MLVNWDLIKMVIASIFGAGLTYGTMRTEIALMKKQLNDYSKYGERLATIEAKLDILIKNFEK